MGDAIRTMNAEGRPWKDDVYDFLLTYRTNSTTNIPYWYIFSRVTNFRESRNFFEKTCSACIKFRECRHLENFRVY